MTRQLRRVGTIILIMFVALFTSTTIIQVVSVDQLNNDPRNIRTLDDSYSVARGQILDAEGDVIAKSVPSNDVYKYQRVYTDPEVYANVTGYFTFNQLNPGIEGAMNDYLSGTSNDQFLSNLQRLVTGQSQQGASVELTIENNVQQVAYNALGNYTGAVVALDPKTGAILAMVSKPSYDPNALSVHSSSKFFAAYDALTQSSSKPLTNRAVAGNLYHPGSVFKPLVASAALDSGKATTTTGYPNPALLRLPLSNSYIHNSNGTTCGPGATATLSIAIQLSCNIPMAEAGAAIGESTISEYATKFGWGKPLSLADGNFNVTPSIYPTGQDAPTLMESAFGQADDRATPLQIAMDSAAIGNGGVLMQPTLIKKVIEPDLSELQVLKPTVYSRPISSTTASAVTQMMIASVADGAASNATIEGVQVAGKTGTAQNGTNDPYTLWFTGFAPADDPQVVVAVVIENGGGNGQDEVGNEIAAPIGKAVIEAVLGK